MSIATGICSIECCCKPTIAKGLCAAHYRRLQRHGSPYGGSTAIGAPKLLLDEVVLPYEGDECLFWPFARHDSGYGQIHLDGKLVRVHRFLCEKRNGPPPTPRHVAAHSCGKGHLGCVTNRHLRWATHKENSADQVIHGTVNNGQRNGLAKLTEQDVLFIRSAASNMTQPEIAKVVGIHPSHVSEIIRRKCWGWLN